MTLAQAYKKQFGKVSYPFEVFDANGNKTYYEDSNGYWSKYEYNDSGKMTYYEESGGYWSKYEYDANGNETYYEDSSGHWEKRDHDANGNETYYENSNGLMEGQRQSSCDGKIVEIDGKKYKLKEL